MPCWWTAANSSADPLMPLARHGEVELHYQTKGKGPTLLFLHGFTASLSMWNAPIRTLSKSFHCLAIDLRGHGRSQSCARNKYSLAAMADDVLQILNDDGTDQAIVIGHSLGGMIAQHLAIYHQNWLTGLVLSSTTCLAPERERFTPLIEGAISLAAMSAAEKEANPALRHSNPLDEDTAWGCGEAVMTLPRYDRQLTNFALPSLIIYGDGDSGTILEGSKQLSASIPECRESVIVGAGHVPQITHSEAYTQALLDFFNDIEMDS